MPMNTLIKYSNIYSRTSRILWQNYRNKPTLDDKNNIIDIPADNNNSISFKFEETIAGQIGGNGTKDVEIMVPLKYLSNFGKTLEIQVINCDISLMLTWSKNCF